MPLATIRGVHINYETFGDKGSWIALSPGSRRSYAELVSLAKRLAVAGYRVMLHDRRNCGASDVSVEGDESEYEIWADDLYELLSQLNALPAYIGGSSSGCRLSILFALRHPKAVKGLLLWRITGGKTASERLAESYYGRYIKAAQAGGMEAVCATEHFHELIEARPSNRDLLMAMDPEKFIAGMTHWREFFIQAANMPVIGATEEDLRAITVPTCLIPGNDQTHTPLASREVHRLLPHSEVHELVHRRPEDDLLKDWDQKDWFGKEGPMAEIFMEFLKRAEA